MNHSTPTGIGTILEEQYPSCAHEVLSDRVSRFLHERVPECDDLIVEDRGSTVILQGRVPSEHTKSLCLQCSQHVAGVIHVIDELNVEEPN